MGSFAESLTVNSSSQLKRPGDKGNGLAGSSHSNGVDQRTGSGEDYTQVLQNFTQIFFFFSTNVHTSALPPWLDTSQENEKNLLNKASDMSNHAFPLVQRGKHKLNPKRVGAAWAEKRRVELEMEKRGEITANICDANWLPNLLEFGKQAQERTLPPCVEMPPAPARPLCPPGRPAWFLPVLGLSSRDPSDTACPFWTLFDPLAAPFASPLARQSSIKSVPIKMLVHIMTLIKISLLLANFGNGLHKLWSSLDCPHK